LLTLAQIMLYSAAALIALGGLYDVLVPKLPSNLARMCGGDEQACKLVRELLRALGGCLVAIGVTMALLVSRFGVPGSRRLLVVVLVLVLPSEGVNAFCMYRVGSPYLVPLGFAVLTMAGVFLEWPGLFS
jgi:uncharacterized protein YjeT (DUF2065 family)